MIIIVHSACAEDDASVQELSIDPQKKELLEARFSGRVSGHISEC